MNKTSFGEKFITSFKIQHNFTEASSEDNKIKCENIAKKIIDKNITAMKYLQDK